MRKNNIIRKITNASFAFLVLASCVAHAMEEEVQVVYTPEAPLKLSDQIRS
jgi:hypothetical protein